MTKIAFKNPATKLFAVIFLCFGILLLSAFKNVNKPKYLTRLDLAQLIEKVLNDSSINMSSSHLPIFSDMTKEQHESIEKVLRYKIMNGYTDNSFRPNEVMRNLEVVSYLHRLNDFLRINNPKCYAAKKLFRILSYSEEPTIAFEYTALNFSKDFEKPNKFTTKKVASEVFYRLSSHNIDTTYTLSGKIIDSISNKPISNAYISANKQAFAIEENGQFSFELPNGTKTAVIFAAADGYQPIEIKKDLRLSRNITIRLRPNFD